MLEYGSRARTNELVNYDDINLVKKESLIPKKRQEDRELPANIIKKHNKFKVCITYKRQVFTNVHDKLDEAILALNEFKQEIEMIKDKEKSEHFAKPIERNLYGKPIIKITNINGDIIEEVVVSEDRWHDVTQFTWSKDVVKNYYMNNKKVYLHRYLTNAKKGEIVDHINEGTNDISNHTNDNLRIASASENSHNRKKKNGCSSEFYGVDFQKKKNKWRSRVRKDGKEYCAGEYLTELDAAKAYNKKALEIYGDKAKLNVFLIQS